MNSVQNNLVTKHFREMVHYLSELADLDLAVKRSLSSRREKFIQTLGVVQKNLQASSARFVSRYREAGYESN